MSSQSRELDRVQRWMQTVIMHADGVAQGIDSEEARRQIDVTADSVEQVVTRSRNQTAIQRLEIYGNAYYARLLECLRDEYPALSYALGQKVFDGFAFGYLQAYPSQSYTLANLGSNFPRYLEETRPEDDHKDEDESGQPSWPEFMIDLARLERTYAEVFDGPGVEGKPLLRTDDLLAVPQQRWHEVTLIPVECLRLTSYRFPVHEYATSVRQKQDPVPPAAVDTWLAITRRDFIVRRSPQSRIQFELLRCLAAGETLGESIGQAAGVTNAAADDDDTGADTEEFAANLNAWFHDWTAAGFFHRVELP
jgi:hypothetical protein